MKRLAIITFATFLANANAGNQIHEPTNVIDLGELSIEGEIRRPSITWIDSQKSVKDLIPIYLKTEFEAFEKQVLESSSLTSALVPLVENKRPGAQDVTE